MTKPTKIPKSFRPLLWYLRWDDLDVQEDKNDIILNVVNDGTIDQWRWLVKMYGKEQIRNVLEQRLRTEFHPGSRNLAEVLFGVTNYHAPRGIDSGSAGIGSQAR